MGTARLALVALLASGCSLLFAPDEPSGAREALFGLEPCGGQGIDNEPVDLLEPGSYLYDTESGRLTGPNTNTLLRSTSGPNRTFIVLGGLRIREGAVLRLGRGPPVIVVSRGDIRIEGTLDLTSVNSKSVGTDEEAAGSEGNTCPPDPPAGTLGAGDGGPGGSFIAPGGSGAGPGGAVQASDPFEPPQSLRGGCPGSQGASGTTAKGGLGGRGGGAVALVACGEIDLREAGQIMAGGSGAEGGFDAAGLGGGGGGGGSGGMIVLDAPSIQLGPDVRLFAVGGGGGGGPDPTGINDGAEGNSGSVALSGNDLGTGGAGGGSAGTDGGDGGALVAGSDQGGDAAPSEGSNAGGGGGGSAGVIFFNTAGQFDPNDADIRPPATDPPQLQ